MVNICVFYSLLPILLIAFVLGKFLLVKRGTRELSIICFIGFFVAVNEGLLKHL